MTNIQRLEEFKSTPLELIWQMADFFEEKHIIGIFNSYHRKVTNAEGLYHGVNNLPEKIDFSSFDQLIGQTMSRSGNIRGGGAEWELAFDGFHMTGEQSDWDCKEAVSHDLPKIDFNCGEELLFSDFGTNFLAEVKNHLNGTDLYIYRTTNSFHLYGAAILDVPGLKAWNEYLVELDKKFPTIMDRKWLTTNYGTGYWPLRVSATSKRGLPQLHAIV